MLCVSNLETRQRKRQRQKFTPYLLPANTPPPALSLLYLDPVHDPKYKEKLQLVHSSRIKTVHPDNTPTPTITSYLWDADRKPPLDLQGLPACQRRPTTGTRPDLVSPTKFTTVLDVVKVKARIRNAISQETNSSSNILNENQQTLPDLKILSNEEEHSKVKRVKMPLQLQGGGASVVALRVPPPRGWTPTSVLVPRCPVGAAAWLRVVQKTRLLAAPGCSPPGVWTHLLIFDSVSAPGAECRTELCAQRVSHTSPQLDEHGVPRGHWHTASTAAGSSRWAAAQTPENRKYQEKDQELNRPKKTNDLDGSKTV
eukprot:bmy_20309T0